MYITKVTYTVFRLSGERRIRCGYYKTLESAQAYADKRVTQNPKHTMVVIRETTYSEVM